MTPPPTRPLSSSLAPATPVRRRRVHYFSGFDPRGAGHYHRLFSQQGERPQPGGGSITTGARQRIGELFHRWTVDWRPAPAAPAASPDDAAVRTEHVFMSWDDIIRRHWSRQPLALLREFAAVQVAMMRDVGLRRVHALHPTALLTALLPLLWLVATLLVGGFVIAAMSALPLTALGDTGLVAVATGVGLALSGMLISLGAQAGLFWLMRIYHFILCMGRGQVAGMDERVQEWVEHVIERQSADPVDEVVRAGHSVGPLVMVEAVDQLLRDPRWQALQAGRRTAMLTLGQCYPCLALLPGAESFRHALLRLSRHPDLVWLDVTARIDPMCFFSTAPLAGTELAEQAGPLPRRRAASFFQMYDPLHWAAIRRDKLQAHFLYLMTPDRPGNFDLFAMLYGPRRFEQQLVETRRR